MMILALVRNYIPSYGQVVDGGWNIADCVARSYDCLLYTSPSPRDRS